jgi:hypothetical protein
LALNGCSTPSCGFFLPIWFGRSGGLDYLKGCQATEILTFYERSIVHFSWILPCASFRKTTYGRSVHHAKYHDSLSVMVFFSTRLFHMGMRRNASFDYTTLHASGKRHERNVQKTPRSQKKKVLSRPLASTDLLDLRGYSSWFSVSFSIHCTQSFCSFVFHLSAWSKSDTSPRHLGAFIHNHEFGLQVRV